MKRVQRIRRVRDTVLIITNGKQTEKNYFNSITNSFKCPYTIKVEYKNSECDELVRYASLLDSSSYNQIWCVFDIDESFAEGHLLSALKDAEKNNIRIAFSNESFEVWLLFHIKDNVSPSLSRKTYIKELNKLLEQKGVSKSYKKNDLELMRDFFIPKLPDAATNAKKIFQKAELEHQNQFCGNKNYPIWSWKSTTNVYKLIEALKLSFKD